MCEWNSLCNEKAKYVLIVNKSKRKVCSKCFEEIEELRNDLQWKEGKVLNYSVEQI